MRLLSPLAGILLLLSVLAISTSSVATATGTKTASLLRTAKNAKLGTILVAPSGKTLYYFSLDRNGVFGCKGPCLQFWFPLVVPHGAKAPAHLAGVSGKLGKINRGHGVMQVTYRGHPLYTFIADQKAGQINGQGYQDFGGIWHAATV